MLPGGLTFNNSTLCPQCLFVCSIVLRPKKKRLFPYTALTVWFVQPRGSVLAARYGPNPKDRNNNFHMKIKSSGSIFVG
jgi:hypothetical protein